MARSNGTQDRTGGQPARQQRAGEPIDHGLPWHNGAAQPAQSFEQPANGQLPWPQQYQPAQTAPPLQQYQAQQTHTPPGYAPPNYPQSQAYAPQPDAHHGHYFPQTAQAPGAADYQQQAYAASAYAPSQAAYQDPATQLRGSYAGHGEPQAYTAPPAQAGYPSQGYAPQHGQDPRSFDLGVYGTPASGYVDPATGRPLPAAGLPPAGVQAALFGHPQAAAAPGELDDEEYEDEDEEEVPRRRFGILKVLGVLTVAVALGGGAAYGVKKFGGSVLTAGTKPVTVKADASPSKQRPASGAADKASERLGGDAIPQVVPAGDNLQGDNGALAQARKVQTIAIPAGNAPPLRPTISIPGVSVEGLAQASAPAQVAALPPVTPAPAGRAVAPPPAAAQQPRAPVAPKVIAAVEDAVAAPKVAPPARIPVAQAPRPSKGNDAYSPVSGVGAASVAAATTAPAPAKASNGFIAVLASQGSAIDARKTLDDLQGKYSEAIGGKPTDVTEFANPRDGKTYYRAVVGPPGSREAAASVCEKVKTAGHKDCFAAPY